MSVQPVHQPPVFFSYPFQDIQVASSEDGLPNRVYEIIQIKWTPQGNLPETNQSFGYTSFKDRPSAISTLAQEIRIAAQERLSKFYQTCCPRTKDRLGHVLSMDFPENSSSKNSLVFVVDSLVYHPSNNTVSADLQVRPSKIVSQDRRPRGLPDYSSNVAIALGACRFSRLEVSEKDFRDFSPDYFSLTELNITLPELPKDLEGHLRRQSYEEDPNVYVFSNLQDVVYTLGPAIQQEFEKQIPNLDQTIPLKKGFDALKDHQPFPSTLTLCVGSLRAIKSKLPFMNPTYTLHIEATLVATQPPRPERDEEKKDSSQKL